MGVKNKLLEIRLSLGYKNSKDFADFLGINKSMYSLIENNKRVVNLENAFAIAEKLNMNIEDIWYKE
ncbi:helix-turn-helix domain-containing protein [Clostridium botulinum]|uniref:helix-turn-helix transcriptional regulator n=1 Tax=Clostridium botulinum TaxID=1491 RepID=UPI000773EC95|nr:helix-turn-helix domain-containing protein [Clostridium botulinum]NFH80309.1 helix-turn-helix domain-containing protein [Clostridium botulinum]NFH83726.1 helix-turn-helix domain-containing protein [Clostridium botulinum]NFI11799.1 helix-turn-helix domain-containing protein [Clostridium botulinum]NFI16235.1 helix-turn-helix domain-containing protein [Clostridium botulinum]NFO84248.1 helix-turn-helix domain-containing protein [Clostridium botulinum]